EPFHPLGADGAEGVRQALIGPGAEAVEGHAEAKDAEFAHDPTTALRRSSISTSRQRPFSFPSFSRRPTRRKPPSAWIRTLPTFSGKIPVCKVQTPFFSDDLINAARSPRPSPFPRPASPTYILTSATPAYAQRSETG